MSLLGQFFQGMSFRSTHPTLQPDSEVNVFLAEYDPSEDAAVAYIGDTRLYVSGTDPEHAGLRVRVAVKEFQPDESIGRGELLEVVGESSYAG